MQVPDEFHRLTIPDHRGVVAWIEVDRSPLTVYSVEKQGKRVEGFVEAQAGQKYQIKVVDLRKQEPRSAYILDFHADGLLLWGRFVPLDWILWEDPNDVDRLSVCDGLHEETTTHSLRFSSLQTASYSNLARHDNALKELGSITVSYNDGRRDAAEGEPVQFPATLCVDENGKGKRLDASRQTSFDEPVSHPASPGCRVKYIKGSESEVCFLYRTKARLLQEGFPVSSDSSPSTSHSPSPKPQCKSAPPELYQSSPSPFSSSPRFSPAFRNPSLHSSSHAFVAACPTASGSPSASEAKAKVAEAEAAAAQAKLEYEKRLREVSAAKSAAEKAGVEVKKVKREEGKVEKEDEAQQVDKGEGRAEWFWEGNVCVLE
ncbi:hypothetical protein JCM8097_004464 [Rhodosporidiobolus ruineniae]